MSINQIGQVGSGVSTPAIETPSDSNAGALTSQVEEQVQSSVQYQILARMVNPATSTQTTPATSQTANQKFESQSSQSYRYSFEAIEQEISMGTSTRISASSDSQSLAVSSQSVIERRLTVQAQQQEQVQQGDPLVLDLDGNGVQTTGVDRGVSFDLDADGDQDRVSVVTGRDAFVAIDKNSNGVIDDGSELFGDQNGDANGFEALAHYDDNHDGVIDQNDAAFDRMRLLQFNADGSQRLETLESAGVESIQTGYSQTEKAINQYDIITQTGEFSFSDGSTGQAVDVVLGFSEIV